MNIQAMRKQGEELCHDGKVLRSNLSAGERNYVTAPWMFAYAPTMKACAPEFGFLGSIKYTIRGDRRVAMCPFHELLGYVIKEHGDPKMTLQNVCDFFSEIGDNAKLMKFLEHVPGTCFCRCEVGSCIIVPWGYVVAEEALNSSEVVGIRWVMVSDKTNMGIASLAQFLMPPDGKVKASSAVGFLLKLIQMSEVDPLARQILKALPAPPQTPQAVKKEDGVVAAPALKKAKLDMS